MKSASLDSSESDSKDLETMISDSTKLLRDQWPQISVSLREGSPPPN